MESPRRFRRRSRSRKRFWLGLICALAAFSVLLRLAVELMPTEWARVALIERLQAETGGLVDLKRVQFTWLGGVRLIGLAIADPDDPARPWLTAEVAAIDVSFADWLGGSIRPGSSDLSGVNIRLRRGAQGRWSPSPAHIGGGRSKGEIKTAHRTDHPASPSPMSARADAGVKLALRWTGGRLEVIDDRSGLRLTLEDWTGQALWSEDALSIKDMQGSLNGGRLELAAQWERGRGAPSTFEGQIRAEGVDWDESIASGMRFLAPIVSRSVNSSLRSKAELRAYLSASGDSEGAILDSLRGQGAFRLDPILLADTRALAEIAELARSRSKIGSLSGEFEVGERKVRHSRLSVAAGTIPIGLSGWTGFDGTLEYQIRASELIAELGPKLQEWVEDLPLEDLRAIRLHGALDDLRLSVESDKEDLSDRIRERIEGQVAKRLRDRELRGARYQDSIRSDHADADGPSSDRAPKKVEDAASPREGTTPR